MAVNNGDLLTSLLVPEYVVQYMSEKDKISFLGCLIKETLGYLNTSLKNEGTTAPSAIFIETGSRASSLRMPNISVFDEHGTKIGSETSDTDVMVMQPEIMVGKSHGDLLLEFVKDENNMGYGKIKAVEVGEKYLSLFVKKKDEDGDELKYLNGASIVMYTLENHRDRYETQIFSNWQKTGPAFERLRVTNTGQKKLKNKVDVVLAIMSADNYYQDEITDVMKKSCWPSEVQETVLSAPISFVHVAPKTCKDDGITWRISFSVQELIIARALSMDQLQLYMLIKYIIQYLLRTVSIPEDIAHKKFSSYIAMNAFFAFCDQNSSKDWSLQKLHHLLQFFQDFRIYLSQGNLPQYLLPANNLLKDVTSKWCDFYLKLFSFQDESSIIKFLLSAQKTWRLAQFECPFQTHWCGDELRVEEAKLLLKKIRTDGAVNLDPVRVVPMMWNQFVISQSLLHESQPCFQTSAMTSKSDDAQCLEFWEEVYTELAELLSKNEITQSKYVQIINLIQKMVPCEDNVTLANLFQQKAETTNGHRNPLDMEDKPYFIAEYDKHADMDNCVIKFYNDNIVVHQAGDRSTTFVFPYTNHLLLLSEPFLYFGSCQKTLKSTNPEEIKQFVEGKLKEEARGNLLLRLIFILKKVFCKDELAFLDICQYVVSSD